MGLEWSHRKKRGKEGGRGGVSVESWTEGKKEGVRVESTILYMSPHRGEKLL